MNLLEFRHVTKTYRKHFWTRNITAVDDLSFAVNPHQIVGFIGPNGAGKTTSLKMLLGLVRPTTGEILVNGRTSDDSRVRSGIAYLSEQPYFYEHLSALESLQFAYRLLRLPPAGESSEIERVLSTVELTSARDRKVREMSKGMQQRLNMAQALLGRAQTCIFDEPMSGLDPLGRQLFRRIFRQLAADGASIFFSTHIIEDIEALCESIIVLSKGKLVYSGSIAEIVDKGFLGTEITTPSIDRTLAEELFAAGCEVTTPRPDQAVVFVPRAGDTADALRRLQAKGVYCTGMTRRNKSLESMLYEVRSGECGKRS